jgi:hypothetical protein
LMRRRSPRFAKRKYKSCSTFPIIFIIK